MKKYILKRCFHLVLSIFSLQLLFGFVYGQSEKKIILISKDYKSTINDWLIGTDPSFTYKEIYRLPSDSLNFYLGVAAGMVIGGGNDVNPAMYGMESKINKCGKLDLIRDSMEYKMIRYGIENKIPLLGICRGNQMMNVSMGGSLITDIPSETNSKIRHRSRKKHTHFVSLKKEGNMYQLVKEDRIKVNSNHHQSIQKTADFFIPFAFADDGIIEGIEIKPVYEHPFAVGIQWHPELLVCDQFSKGLAILFLKSCRNR